MDMKALIARMDAIAEANRPADYNAERDHPLTQYDDDPKPDSAAKPSSSSSEPDSDGDRSKGDAPIVHRDAEKDGVPGVNNTPGPDSDAANYDFAPQGSDNPPGGPQAADDKTKTAQDATDQLDKDNGKSPVVADGEPSPAEVSKFAGLLLKCKDSGWRVPITPNTAQQALQMANQGTSETYTETLNFFRYVNTIKEEQMLVENPVALLRFLTAAGMTARLRSAFLSAAGVPSNAIRQIIRMNPAGFRSGNLSRAQLRAIQRYLGNAKNSIRANPQAAKQKASKLRNDPRVRNDLNQAQKGGTLSTLGKLAGLAGLGYLGYELWNWLTGDDQEQPADAAGGDGTITGKPGGSGSPQPGTQGGTGTQPCLNPQEIADLDKMAADWQNVKNPSIQALVAAWSAVKPIMMKTESKGNPMDMKSMIARMDAIENNKKITEYKGGTDQERINAFTKQAKDMRDKGFYRAASDTEKVAKDIYKPKSEPKKEGMGSIARALMQDMGIDEEGDPAWYGPGGANLMTGEPTAPGTGNPYKDIKAANRDRLNQRTANRGAAATQAAANANPEVYGYGGAPQTAAEQPAAQQAAAGTQADAAFQQANRQEPAASAPATTVANWQEPGTTTSAAASPQPAKTGGSEMDTPAPAGITPAGQAKPAAQATPAAPAKTGGISKAVSDLAAANNITNPNMIKVGQQLKMPDGSTYVVKPGDTLSKIAGGGKQAAASPQPNNPIAAGYTQAQQNVVPGAGGVTESDNQILALIRGVKF